MENYVLDNGLNIYYYNIPTSYSISVGMYVRVGSRNETKENNGISHLLEHLHFRKLGKMTQKELYKKMDTIGTTLRASTYKDFTKYYLKVRPKYFLQSLCFIKEIIEMYGWDDEDLKLEKRVVLSEIKEKNSYTYGNKNLDSLLWKENAMSFSVIGTKDNIECLTLHDLVNYKKKFYNKNNIALFIVGNFSEKDVISSNDYLSQIKLSDEIPVEQPPDPILFKRKPDIYFCEFCWNNLDVNICFDVDLKSVGHEPLTIINSMLGGGTTSLLQLKIREELGLCANIYSEIESYRNVAIINISYSVDKNNFYISIKEIVNILKTIKETVSEDLIKTNFPYYTENLWYWLEDPDTYNFQIAWDTYILKNSFCTIQQQIEKFNNVTMEGLAKTSRIIFDKENISVFVVGSTRKITKKEIKSIFSEL